MNPQYDGSFSPNSEIDDFFLYFGTTHVIDESWILHSHLQLQDKLWLPYINNVFFYWGKLMKAINSQVTLAPPQQLLAPLQVRRVEFRFAAALGLVSVSCVLRCLQSESPAFIYHCSVDQTLPYLTFPQPQLYMDRRSER